MKHETHPSKLHLTAIVATHYLKYHFLYLVSSNSIICANHPSTNYRIHHFNFFRLFFSFHSWVYFAPTSSRHPYKIQHLGFLVSA